VWSFGPPLLDENGNTMKSYNVSTAVSFPNPRSAIGYYEPGHCCFVLVDGRQDGYSKGMTIPELAQVFQDLGCKAAYNLDGGGSAVMMFDHKTYSKQSNGADRKLGDLLVIRDSYSNCLGTFLANSYETVVLIDLRYYKEPLTELLAQEEFDDVLVCYSLGNFMTDNNLFKLS
jgi:hypothetical protein